MAASTWLEVIPVTHPSARHGARLAPDVSADRLILWGGSGMTKGRDATFGTWAPHTWAWDGADWIQVSAEVPDGEMPGAAVGLPDGVLSYGGLRLRRGVTFLPIDDTWRWTSAGWAKLRCDIRPSARTGAALAFDEGSGTVLLFGGSRDMAGANCLGDTWSWDGTAWSERRPTLSPPPRAGATMYFDRDTQRVVLTGGRGAGLNSLADTWTWNGTNWEPVDISSPTFQLWDGAAYHVAARTLMRFGGRARGAGAARETRTWMLRSGSWVSEELVPSPSPRMHPAVAYHEQSERIVLFGGLEFVDNNRDALGDTWTFRPGSVGSEARD